MFKNDTFCTIYSIHLYIGWSKKMAQPLVRHNFQTAHKKSINFYTTFFEHDDIRFQNHWTTNVEMAVA